MKRTPSLILATALALLVAAPLAAQENNVYWAYFVTTTDADYADFQDGLREHSQWHADQNDPWAWVAYEALTGNAPEFVVLSPAHNWSDFDNRPVDGAADGEHWGETAGEHVATTRSVIWTMDTERSMPAPPDQTVPMYEVIEWELLHGSEGQSAVMNAMARTKEAFEESGAPINYSFNVVESDMGGPRLFVAIPHQGFADFEGGDPDFFNRMMIEAHGHEDGMAYIRAFDKHLKPLGRRFWVLREDLSHMPPAM